MEEYHLSVEKKLKTNSGKISNLEERPEHTNRTRPYSVEEENNNIRYQISLVKCNPALHTLDPHRNKVDQDIITLVRQG